jgi:hypothetical protein
MKSLVIISFLGLALLLPQTGMGADDITIPLEINGFKLGASIEEYEFLKQRNYLKEVMVDDIGGFRRGMISFGNCERQGEVVKIKLKYKDDTHKFYKKLLKRFKKKFGKPEEFTGDAFGIVLSWKWRFRDKDNNYILLTLQHNKKNMEETMGNMVKLSMPDRIEAERKCFLKICETDKIACPINMMNDDWDNLIPR